MTIERDIELSEEIDVWRRRVQYWRSVVAERRFNKSVVRDSKREAQTTLNSVFPLWACRNDN